MNDTTGLHCWGVAMVFENMIDSAQAGVLVPALISVSALLTGDTSELLTILSTAVTHKNTKHLLSCLVRMHSGIRC